MGEQRAKEEVADETQLLNIMSTKETEDGQEAKAKLRPSYR